MSYVGIIKTLYQVLKRIGSEQQVRTLNQIEMTHKLGLVVTVLPKTRPCSVKDCVDL